MIREVRPQRVVCQSPERNWERIYGSHPDHLAAGEATMCAVYPDARNPFTFADAIGDLEAWTVNEVWVSRAATANHYVDITAQFERKKQALLRHESQITSAGEPAQHAALLERRQRQSRRHAGGHLRRGLLGHGRD